MVVALHACGSDAPSGPRTGGVEIVVSGLPVGIDAALTVAGPAAFSRVLTGTGSLSALVPGTYTVAAAPVVAAAATYQATPAQQTITVSAGRQPASARVAYALVSGDLEVEITGLPAGAAGAVLVIAAGSPGRPVTATQTLAGVLAGEYDIVATNVVAGGATYAPSPATQHVIVLAGGIVSAAPIAYTLASGTLALSISGLPAGAAASVTIASGGFSQVVTGSRTLGNLLAGTYSVTAANVVSGPTTYAPTPVSQSVAVAAGGAAAASVAYALLSASALNLRIDGMYLTQSVQTYDGAVPLVRDRDGYLRVFVVANQSNTTAAAVRARFYVGATLVYTATISAPSSSVPTAVNQFSFFRSWNVAVPGSLIQPGLSIIAEVDPDHAIAEADESDNVFPASGTPLALNVQTLPTLAIRFVPIVQSGVMGNVSNANKEAFLTTTRRMHPIAAYDAEVRAPYTTSALPLQSDNANGAWGKILSELNALRVAEGSTRNYFGVVHASYTSGTSGIGYVGGRAALGWDYLPSGDGVVAHELGHNWGRLHAPCGAPPNVDTSYPYADGVTGVYGLDIVTTAIKSPMASDIMGYCSNQWISDYTYSGILAYRVASGVPVAAAGAAGVVQPSLLVWGRVEQGRLVLEPAFTIVARPVPPRQTGPYRVEGLAADGSTVFSIPFGMETVADAPAGSDAQFAFVIPLDAATESRLATLRLSAAGQEVRAPSIQVPAGSPTVDPQPAPAAEALGDGRVQLRWNAAAHPMVMVRDARTGDILSFARGGAATVSSRDAELELVLSDRVRSVSRRVRVQRR